jgi:hypothetical protein
LVKVIRLMFACPWSELVFWLICAFGKSQPPTAPRRFGWKPLGIEWELFVAVWSRVSVASHTSPVLGGHGPIFGQVRPFRWDMAELQLPTCPAAA